MLRRPTDEPLIPPEPPLWERGAVIFVLVMLTGALIGPIFAPLQQETPMLRLIWPPVYLVIMGLCVWRFETIARAWPAWIIVGLLILYAFASKYWSIDPGVTQRRTIALAFSSAFAVYLGAAFPGRHLARVLTEAGILMGVGSLILVFAWPAVGIHQYENAGLWRGMWYEKNQMGLVMVATAVAASASLASGDPRRVLPIVTLIVSTALVLATQSKTSLLCLLLGVGLIAGLWTLRKAGPALAVAGVWLGTVIGAVGIYFVAFAPGVILEALGKDPSLTGRTDIWAALMRRVADRPMTGYGYSAFWERDSAQADFIRLETGWDVPSAHNGWIDLLVQLGWPGAVVVGAVIAIATLAVLIRLGGMGVREGFWSAGYLIVFVVLSLSESVLLNHANLPWALLLVVLARALAKDPLPAPARLAPARRRAYQTSPRIAAWSRHGQA